MFRFLFFLAACYFNHFGLCVVVEDGLVGVSVIYRHGDRTPIKTYPTDPYSDSSYWPVGFGQLTNIGKQQQYELGQWIRDRYSNFLPMRYSKKFTYILSTDVDRTLMSAQANLAGLFPPQKEEIWKEDLHWQPIPVHTIPEKGDNILRMKMPCEKDKYLFDQLMKSDEFVKINKENHDLYVYLSKKSGMSVKNIREVKNLYTTLMIEQNYNYTLPKWTKSVFPDKMAPLAHLAFAVKCYTPELARLKAGPLLNHITQNFLKLTDNKGFKFSVYSAHDTTVANVLTSLNAFDYHAPPFAATIIFELRYINDSFFINILYKNSSVAQEIKLKGCDYYCHLYRFKTILKPLLITPEEWKEECVLNSGIFPYSLLNGTGICIIVVGLLFIAGVIMFLFYKLRELRRLDYIELPK